MIKFSHIVRQFLGSLLLVGCVSCDDGSVVLPQDNSFILPFGTISQQPQKGRSFMITSQLKMSEYASSIKVEWECNTEGTTPGDIKDDMTSSREFVWDETGAVDVTCRVNYMYGNENKSVYRTETFAVLPPVYGSVFFNDKYDFVKGLYPEAEEKENYLGNMELVINHSDNEYDRLIFLDDRLDHVETKRVEEYVENPYSHICTYYEKIDTDFLAESWLFMTIVFKNGMTDEIASELESINKKIEEGEQLTGSDQDFLNDCYYDGLTYYNVECEYDYKGFGFSTLYYIRYENGKHTIYSSSYNNKTE